MIFVITTLSPQRKPENQIWTYQVKFSYHQQLGFSKDVLVKECYAKNFCLTYTDSELVLIKLKENKFKCQDCIIL